MRTEVAKNTQDMRTEVTKNTQEVRADSAMKEEKLRAKLKKTAKGVSTEIAKIELKNNEILQELKLSNINANARFDRLLMSLISNPNPPVPMRSHSVSLFK